MYSPMIHRLYVALCACHPQSDLPSRRLTPFTPSYPDPLPQVTTILSYVPIRFCLLVPDLFNTSHRPSQIALSTVRWSFVLEIPLCKTSIACNLTSDMVINGFLEISSCSTLKPPPLIFIACLCTLPSPSIYLLPVRRR